jgi:hypothetical protein
MKSVSAIVKNIGQKCKGNSEEKTETEFVNVLRIPGIDYEESIPPACVA